MQNKEQLSKQIAQIMQENITFSGQTGNYVVHGAIEKIIELFENDDLQQAISCRQKLLQFIKETFTADELKKLLIAIKMNFVFCKKDGKTLEDYHTTYLDQFEKIWSKIEGLLFSKTNEKGFFVIAKEYYSLFNLKHTEPYDYMMEKELINTAIFEIENNK